MSVLLKKTLLASAVLGLSSIAQATIVTSVKPLGFIASSIANGVTDTEVIVPAYASPHDYSLKPTDILKLRSGNLVVWVGKHVDSFLDSAIDQLPQNEVLTLADLPQFKQDPALLLNEEAHDHDHAEEADEDDEGINWHIWLSPKIGNFIAEAIATRLEKIYPDKTAQIKANLVQFQQNLAKENGVIKQELSPLKDKGFYVFHDAYGYFNRAYGLKQLGYFTINPMITPGAKTLAAIKKEVADHAVQCLFTEPQFTPKMIDILHKEMHVKVGVLDPMGSDIPLSKDAYTQFLQSLANGYAKCLG